jgi:hypothetical protein
MNKETHICKWCKAETWQSDDECYAKQEIIEEMALKYAGLKVIDSDERYYQSSKCDKYDSFIDGAKWQQERMYSEAIEFGEWIRNNPYVWNYPDKLNDKRTTEELFEQFKKK